MSPDLPQVLFVDDEESILKGFKLNLGRKYSVFCANSGSEGLRLLEEEGPFEVVVSDFAMPGLNGADFLEKVREQDKEVVTILLTGQANFDDLCDVVRRGEIFRLLGKPCSPETLDENLKQALRQYELIRSEKELLEKTLNGAIGAMTSLLAAANPLFFGRAQRVKRLSRKVAQEMRLAHEWRLEVAVDFCYLGFLTLPEDIQKLVYESGEVSQELQKVIDGFPEFVSNLLKDIPRLNKIRRIIELVGSDYEDSVDGESDERMVASVIRLAQEFDQYACRGCSKSETFEGLRKMESVFLPGALDALANSLELSGGVMNARSLCLSELAPGMRLRNDLRSPDGEMMAPAGSVVNLALLQLLRSHLAAFGESSFPKEIEVLA